MSKLRHCFSWPVGIVLAALAAIGWLLAAGLTVTAVSLLVIGGFLLLEERCRFLSPTLRCQAVAEILAGIEREQAGLLARLTTAPAEWSARLVTAYVGSCARQQLTLAQGERARLVLPMLVAILSCFAQALFALVVDRPLEARLLAGCGLAGICAWATSALTARSADQRLARTLQADSAKRCADMLAALANGERPVPPN